MPRLSWAPIKADTAAGSSAPVYELDPITGAMLLDEIGIGPAPVVGTPVQTAPAPVAQSPSIQTSVQQADDGGSFGTIVAVGSIALAVGVAAYIWSR